MKNVLFSGTAFKLDKRAKENPFLPHICVKNTEVKILCDSETLQILFIVIIS